jgi:hypothetical protein
MAGEARSAYRKAPVVITLFLLFLGNSLNSQSELSGDKAQIMKLLTGIADHSLRPADALDPTMGPHQRADNLEYFDDPSYQLTLIPVGAIEIKADGSATVPVRVRLKTEHNEMEATNTARFITRNQRWYFANYGFLALSTFLVVVAIVGPLVGVLYAAGVLLLRRRLSRQGRLTVGNRAKIFIPFFWPNLFRKA